ncbi:MAG: hypothetical protein OEV35_00015 [Gallionellaceae bacterium]|nr:hypothetical protein [Gallionellaceae bacterium]
MLITLVINMGGWTFNKEAVADVWFDGQGSMVVNADGSLAESAVVQGGSLENTCNHWCHAAVHWVGLLNQWTYVTPEFANRQFFNISFVIDYSFPDGLFRPPRHLS